MLYRDIAVYLRLNLAIPNPYGPVFYCLSKCAQKNTFHIVVIRKRFCKFGIDQSILIERVGIDNISWATIGFGDKYWRLHILWRGVDKVSEGARERHDQLFRYLDTSYLGGMFQPKIGILSTIEQENGGVRARWLRDGRTGGGGIGGSQLRRDQIVELFCFGSGSSCVGPCMCSRYLRGGSRSDICCWLNTWPGRVLGTELG